MSPRRTSGERDQGLVEGLGIRDWGLVSANLQFSFFNLHFSFCIPSLFPLPSPLFSSSNPCFSERQSIMPVIRPTTGALGEGMGLVDSKSKVGPEENRPATCEGWETYVKAPISNPSPNSTVAIRYATGQPEQKQPAARYGAAASKGDGETVDMPSIVDPDSHKAAINELASIWRFALLTARLTRRWSFNATCIRQ